MIEGEGFLILSGITQLRYDKYYIDANGIYGELKVIYIDSAL